MRQAVSIGATLCAFLVGCSAGTSDSPPPAPVDWHAFQPRPKPDASKAAPTAKELAVAQAYARTLESPAITALGPQLDDDVHFSFPGMEDARGRDAVVHKHSILFGAFDDRRVTTTRVFRTDSIQALEWTMAGTQAREWMGVPATRKPVVMAGFTILWTKDDGAILDVHIYFDIAVVKAALGVGPKGLLALPPLPAPSTPPQIYDQTGSPQETSAVGLVHASLDALEGTSEPAFIDNFADDFEVFTLQRAQPGRGKDDARAYFKATHKAIAQLDTTVDNAWGIDRFVVTEYTIAGEQLGPIGWIPVQRDKVVRFHVVQVNEVREGKIARTWRYDNPSEVLGAP
jgi:hypothetical protein